MFYSFCSAREFAKHRQQYGKRSFKVLVNLEKIWHATRLKIFKNKWRGFEREESKG
jgi:hypothetical protein